MDLFLEVVPVEGAVRALCSIAKHVPDEKVALGKAHNRILAEDATADDDIPGFTRSVVDGYGLRASDTSGAGEAMPAMLKLRGSVAIGEADAPVIVAGECVYVPTGGILPEGADAMAMIEDCERVGDEVLVHRPAAPGENVLIRGDDFREGETVLARGRRLSPRDLGVLGALGYSQVKVSGRPVAGIISTGNELVSVEERPGAAEVRDVNSHLCSGFAEACNCESRIYGIVRDERDALTDAISRAVQECDLVLISGGSSKGEHDMCASIIKEAGEVLVHGIAIAPGKPTIIGRVGDTPVIGLPGHPASAYVVLIALVRHLISAMTGEKSEPLVRQAVLTSNIASARGREDYVRASLSGNKATPLFGKSGLTNTLVRSAGLIRIPQEREGLEAGENVDVILW